MHNNSPIHTAGITKNWFGENGIPLVHWPPQSPDMTPIEHYWAELKDRIYTPYPDFKPFDGAKE